VPRYAALALLAAGCSAQTGARSGDDATVLYLREAVPAQGSSFDWVGTVTRDLGTLSPEPPASLERRSCGSVIAFAATPGTIPGASVVLDDVLVNVWWATGNQRAWLHLGAPGVTGALADAPLIAAPTGDPRRAGAYTQSTVRLPVGRTLERQQLDGLYLAIEATSAMVRMATCDAQPSMLVLNPADEVVLGGAVPGTPEDCLSSLVEFTAPAFERPTLPTPGGRLDLSDVDDELLIEGEVLSQRGALVVRGSLTLRGAGLLLEPGDPGPRQHPIIHVREGGRLELMEGSVLGPMDAPRGFSIIAERGSTVRIHDSTLLYPGFVSIRDDGGREPWAAGVVARGDDLEVLRSRIVGGFEGLDVSGDGARIEGNRFERNGLSIRARGSGGRLADNISVADGTFVELWGEGEGWTVDGNVSVGAFDRAFHLPQGARGARFHDNGFVGTGNRWDFRAEISESMSGNWGCGGKRDVPANSMPGRGTPPQDRELPQDHPDCEIKRWLAPSG